MRIITKVAAISILLGIVILSIPSGSNSRSSSNDKGMIQRIENNGSFLEILKYWGNFQTITSDPSKIRDASINENSTKNISEAGNSIFEEIKLDNSFIEAPESCDEFETVIVNSSKFRELVSNETLNLNLMGADYEFKLQERETQNQRVNSYSGCIVGKPQSSAFFTVKKDSIDGCINVDFYTLSYGIASTDEKYNGKIVHILWRCYSEGGEEEVKKYHSLDPLEFSLRNSDKKSHQVHIELVDFYNKSVFKENYTMNPGDEIVSPEINVEPGYYRYKIILDNRSTFEQRVMANYAANVGGSEKMHLTVRDNPDDPIEFGMEIA
jgi:hypothetical protein